MSNSKYHINNYPIGLITWDYIEKYNFRFPSFVLEYWGTGCLIRFINEKNYQYKKDLIKRRLK